MNSDTPTPKSFAGVIELWPTAVDLADDIDEKEVTVRAWKRRGIPAQYWTKIVTAATKRGFNQVTYELLAQLAAGAGVQTEVAA